MHQNPEERIKRLERSVQRWRLISLALLLTLVSCLAISCTFGIVWFLRGVDDEFLMIHAERDRAEEEHRRAVQAQREAEGRRVQTWQKGANLAEGCKPGRRVQIWQKGANLAEGCKRCKKWVSPLHPCTFCTFACLLTR